jgi:hypothetical protein
MKITICGSIAFYEEMQAAQKTLEALGHEVQIPYANFTDDDGNPISIPEAYAVRQTAAAEDAHIWGEKNAAIMDHFDKIAEGDVILVLNYNKKKVTNYIGGNTLMEMGLALYLHKPIYLLNPIPDQPYAEELRALQPIILNGNLTQIRA